MEITGSYIVSTRIINLNPKIMKAGIESIKKHPAYWSEKIENELYGAGLLKNKHIRKAGKIIEKILRKYKKELDGK